MQIGCDYEVSDTYRFRVLLLSFEFTMSNFLYKYLGIYFSRSLSFSYHINCYLKDGLCLVGWQDNFTVLECGRSWVRANGSNKYYNIGICCFSAKHALRRERAKIGWLGIRILCPSGATCPEPYLDEERP